MNIRRLETRDHHAWKGMWNAYCAFYEAEVPESVTAETWRRLLDPQEPMFGLVADEDGSVVGMLNAVLHLNTWSDKPVCYLQDLFIDPEARCCGVARALIENLTERGRRKGWHRIYWMTKGDNHAARSVYDRIAPVTSWVRYDLPL